MPGLACRWREEQLFDSGSACEPLATGGHCLATRVREGGRCTAQYGCRDDTVRYWRDHGAGTAGVIALEPGHRLAFEENLDPALEGCDLSGPVPLPSACSCTP
ncbi:MAG: hypothetical protein AAF721_13435 [Myxococcota bacterium]